MSGRTGDIVAEHSQHRAFAEILLAVKAFRAGEELTWDQCGLLTQALPARMKSLEDMTGTRRRHTYLMLADRIRTNTPLNVVEEMALEELEACMLRAQNEESGVKMRELGVAAGERARGLISSELLGVKLQEVLDTSV